MQSLERDLYAGAFSAWNMREVPVSGDFGPAGTLHAFDGAMGHGTYWTYFRGNLFAVNTFDLSFEARGTMVYPHAEHLSIALYESGAQLGCSDGRRDDPAHTVQAYVGDEGGVYRATFQAGATMRGTSITVSPDYYRDGLMARFGDVGDMRRAFEAVNGAHDLFDLADLLRKARDYRGQGPAADLFYEGVVAEALALVMSHAQARRVSDKNGAVPLSAQDRELMERLARYIEENPGADLSSQTLARRVCMGQTKFKQAFRAQLGSTPHAFVTGARMRRARELLEAGELSVAQVARDVGYEKPSAFAQAFRRATGLSPHELRGRI